MCRDITWQALLFMSSPTMALSYEDLTIVNHRYRVAEQFPPIRYKSISAAVNSPRKTWRFRLTLLRVVVASREMSLSPHALVRPAKI